MARLARTTTRTSDASTCTGRWSMKYTAGLIRTHPDLSTTYATAKPMTVPSAVPTPPDHDELVVVLKHAGVEQPRDLEAPEPGNRDPEGRVDLGLRHRNQGDHVAGVDREPVSESGAQQDAAVHVGLGGAEGEVAFLDGLRQRGDGVSACVGVE